MHLAPTQRIGEQLERVRTLCGLTKEQMCAEIGVPGRTYRYWISGRKARGIHIRKIVPELDRLMQVHREAERIRLLREEASRANFQRPYNKSGRDAA